MPLTKKKDKNLLNKGQKKSILAVTYNIAGNHNRYNTKKICQVLIDLKPDLVFLQEVSNKRCGNFLTQAHAIASELRMNCIFAKSDERFGGIERVYGNAILSLYPIHNITEISLPRGSLYTDDGFRMPGQLEKRLALGAIVSPIKDNPLYDFLCISTHFGLYNTQAATMGKKGEIPEAGKPIENIREYIKSFGKKNMPCILGGDLNMKPDSDIIKLIEKDWNTNIILSDEPTFDNNFLDDKGIKIDYILDRPCDKYKMSRQKSITYQDSYMASDHRPLMAEWIMK